MYGVFDLRLFMVDLYVLDFRFLILGSMESIKRGTFLYILKFIIVRIPYCSNAFYMPTNCFEKTKPRERLHDLLIWECIQVYLSNLMTYRERLTVFFLNHFVY